MFGVKIIRMKINSNYIQTNTVYMEEARNCISFLKVEAKGFEQACKLFKVSGCIL
jgi:hypothetical protein